MAGIGRVAGRRGRCHRRDGRNGRRGSDGCDWNCRRDGCDRTFGRVGSYGRDRRTGCAGYARCSGDSGPDGSDRPGRYHRCDRRHWRDRRDGCNGRNRCSWRRTGLGSIVERTSNVNYTEFASPQRLHDRLLAAEHDRLNLRLCRPRSATPGRIFVHQAQPTRQRFQQLHGDSAVGRQPRRDAQRDVHRSTRCATTVTAPSWCSRTAHDVVDPRARASTLTP